jgi:hypothetical protein
MTDYAAGPGGLPAYIPPYTTEPSQGFSFGGVYDALRAASEYANPFAWDRVTNPAYSPLLDPGSERWVAPSIMVNRYRARADQDRRELERSLHSSPQSGAAGAYAYPRRFALPTTAPATGEFHGMPVMPPFMPPPDYMNAMSRYLSGVYASQRPVASDGYDAWSSLPPPPPDPPPLSPRLETEGYMRGEAARQRYLADQRAMSPGTPLSPRQETEGYMRDEYARQKWLADVRANLASPPVPPSRPPSRLDYWR